jgi:hypothetical protein
MRCILLVWALLLAGIFCLLRQPMPQAYWQSRAQNASATACTAPTIDPNVTAVQFADWSSGMTFVLPALSSTNGSVVVVMFLETNGLNTGATITVTDSAMLFSFGVSSSNGTIWTGTNRASTDLSSSFTEFAGKSANTSPLSNDIITVTYSLTPSFATAHAFVVDGTRFSAPFDGTPVPVAGAGAPVISTTNPCTMVVSGFAETGTAAPSLPWVQILQRNFLFTQYGRFTSAQTGLTVSEGGGSSNKSIADALTSP